MRTESTRNCCASSLPSVGRGHARHSTVVLATRVTLARGATADCTSSRSTASASGSTRSRARCSRRVSSQRLDRGGRRRRRDLEPDDLREGARRPATGTTSSSARSSSAPTTRSEVFFALAVEDIKRACDLLRPVWERTDGVDGFVSLEVDPDLAYEREATFEQAKLLHELVDATEPLREDPRDRARASARSRTRSPRPLDQRHAHLLARAPRGGRRGVRPRARAARRGRRRPDARRVGRELLRLARRHRGRPPARRGRPRGSAGAARGRQREARVPALPRDLLRARAGRRSPPRVRGRSAACGRRPRRRTRRTATSSTSRS